MRRLLAQRKITRWRVDWTKVRKEVKGAEEDLKTAQISIDERNFKWATVQGYYSMFHAARALIFARGFREKSHRALLFAVEELYGGSIGVELLESMENSMDLREEADYGLLYNKDSAKGIVKDAERFLETVRKILKT